MRFCHWVPASALLLAGTILAVLAIAGCPQSGGSGLLPAGGDTGAGSSNGATQNNTGGTGGGSGPQLVLTAGEVTPLVQARFTTVDRSINIWNVHYGLGPVMADYGNRFAMMQLAAAAGDWWHAEYQYDEINELKQVADIIASEHAPALDQFHQSAFSPLVTDILAKDLASFNTHASAAIAACNSCHVATGQGAIVIQAPTINPQDVLAFSAVDPYTPYSGNPYQTPTPPFTSDKLLNWTDLDAYLDFYFNTLDMSLPLWTVQNGSGPLMLEGGIRYATAKVAAEAQDWATAEYQLNQLIDNMQVNGITRPFRYDALNNYRYQYLQPVVDAVSVQNKTSFDAAYTNAMQGCNHCHVSTGHQGVVVQLPTRAPQPVLVFGPTQVRGSSLSTTPPTPTFPNTAPTADDAANLLLSKLNVRDPALGLWHVQPSMGRNMLQSGQRFTHIWFAGEAGNWPLATYHLNHVAELYRIAAYNYPERATGLQTFSASYIQPLQAAVASGDKAAFESSYRSAINGCNSCHIASGRDFIVVGTPTQPVGDYVKP